jgi:hypothetical protein
MGKEQKKEPTERTGVLKGGHINNILLFYLSPPSGCLVGRTD